MKNEKAKIKALTEFDIPQACLDCSKPQTLGVSCSRYGDFGCGLFLEQHPETKCPPRSHTPNPSDIVRAFMDCQNEDTRINEAVESASMELDWSDTPDKDRQTAEAGAVALMLSAPDLLAALEMIQEAFVHKPGDIAGNKARTAPLKYCNAEFSAALNAAGAAISKAKGE